MNIPGPIARPPAHRSRDNGINAGGRPTKARSQDTNTFKRRLPGVEEEEDASRPSTEGNNNNPNSPSQTPVPRLVVGEYTAATSYYFVLLLASPARV